MSSNSGRTSSWLHAFPFHPLLFAVYPILALLAFNSSEVDASSSLRPLLLSVLLSGFIVLISHGFLRDWNRAALVATIVLILFFSYGHIYIALKAINLQGLYLFRHRTLVPKRYRGSTAQAAVCIYCSGTPD
jgi:hypothetical protein